MIGTREKLGRGFRFDLLRELPSVERYARTLTRGDFDAQDLVHDTLVRAYEKRGSFRIGHDMRVWLLSILPQRLRRWSPGPRRGSSTSRVVGRARSATTSSTAGPPCTALPSSAGVSPASRRAASGSLPGSHRRPDPSEAATALDIPVGTLMSRTARARDPPCQYEFRGPRTEPWVRSDTGGREEVRLMSHLWHLFLAFCAGVACHYILTNPVAEYPIFSDDNSYVQMWKRTRQ
jgi:RNA polymerase sigma-70 factor, ECF subfamily